MSKITALPAATDIVDADLVPVVDDPAGVPATKKATFSLIWTWIQTKFAAGIATFLGTPSSANLAAAVTDKTGTGSLVFANTPTLVTPNVGAATGTSVNLSSHVALGGGTMPTAGLVRVPNGSTQNIISKRNAVDTDDTSLVHYTQPSDSLSIGTDNTFGGARQVSGINVYAAPGGAIGIGLGGGTNVYITAAGTGAYQNVNLGLYGGAPSFPSSGSGVGVFCVGNAGTVPTTNPSSGGVLYAEAGAGKWRGSSGTVTTFGPADPHCPTCGRDFAIEHRNDDMGEHTAVCVPCMIDSLAASGVSVSGFAMVNKRSKTKAEWDAHMSAPKAPPPAEKLPAAESRVPKVVK